MRINSIEEYLAALYCKASTFISYDTLEVFADDETDVGIRLLSESPSPEQVTILHDLFEHLLADSRWLLSIIQNTPEVLATPTTGRVTRSSISKFLRKKRWNRFKIEKVIKEVEGFLVEIQST